MGLLDFSTNVSSKKRLDFNDARYQLTDKLRQNSKKNTRQTFTLYDSKDSNKVAVQDISAAYAVSDKRLPVGELLNKMIDLIIDMEDGELNTRKDAIYAWKYAKALVIMYDDKRKRQEKLTAFDNGLKNSIINSKVFLNRYPGKYTGKTNFFDQKVKDEFEKDIVDTFQEVALPGIHDAAIQQSKQVAEKHANPTLDKIVQWAVENYGCTVDSYFEVQEDKETHLFYSTNTIILHLKNGYDMSVIGYVGTDHDDQFAMSILNANNIDMAQHSDRVSQNDIQEMLADTSAQAAIDPLKKLLEFEKNKNDVLRKQYEILSTIRPMVPVKALELKAAESVVGKDYIWGCQQFRSTHEDLPEDFKLSDIELPQYQNEQEDGLTQNDIHVDVDAAAASLISSNIQGNEVVDGARAIVKENQGTIVNDHMFAHEGEEDMFSNTMSENDETEDVFGSANVEDPIESAESHAPQPELPKFEQPQAIEDVLAPAMPENLFHEEAPDTKPAEPRKFGDPAKVENEFQMPVLNIGPVVAKPQAEEKKKSEPEFNPAATLLPGFTPPKPKEEPKAPSVTELAQPAPTKTQESSTLLPGVKPVETPKGDDKAKPVDKAKNTEISFDDLDSLFE
jgi:hypothetical protein